MEALATLEKDYIDAAAPERDGPINILAVDDDKVILEFLAAQVKDLGHILHKADDGQKALAVLEDGRDGIDIVLMDWAMPIMDGLTAIRHMKGNRKLRHIPVIMLTGADKPEEIEKGLEAGVFYYLTKPVKKVILRSVLESAGRAARQNKALARELKQHRMGFDLMESCKFRFRTLAEAESLAVFMANCFPDPGRVLSGLGELLVNAVEHGNLGIGYQGKHKLTETGMWRAEVERLQALPEHAGKFATATISRKDDGIYVVVEDQGDGFDWKKFMAIDAARAGDAYGRGIAQARAVSFDKLTYNEAGNKAIAFARHGGTLEW